MRALKSDVLLFWCLVDLAFMDGAHVVSLGSPLRPDLSPQISEARESPHKGFPLHFHSLQSSLPRLSLSYPPLFSHLQISHCLQDKKCLPLVGFCLLKFTSSLRKLILRNHEHYVSDLFWNLFLYRLASLKKWYVGNWVVLHPDPNSNPVLLTRRSCMSHFTF